LLSGEVEILLQTLKRQREGAYNPIPLTVDILGFDHRTDSKIRTG
jgi:hypothetical protein